MLRLFARALFAWLVLTAPLAAQDWPTKTVRFIVPFGPGATPDTIARLIADRLQQKLGQNFVVENKAGASGMTGTDAVAKAEPDGHTIGISLGGALAINTLLFSKMPYDPAKEIALITILTNQPSALAVPASLGVNSVAELVALLKKDPGKYNFGSIGNGSLSHLAMEAIAQSSGTQLTHVPYGSSPQAMTALIRGDVQMAVMPAISVTPHAQSGAVKILAVTTAKRSPLLAGCPDPEGERDRRRGGRLERPDRARRHAAGGAGEDPSRSRRGDPVRRAEREVHRADHGAGRQLAGRVQGADRARSRALDAGDQSRRDQGELSARRDRKRGQGTRRTGLHPRGATRAIRPSALHCGEIDRAARIAEVVEPSGAPGPASLARRRG